MNITIENSGYTAKINIFGAETTSFVRKSDGKEIIWQPDPKGWKGQAYNLFPFCGRLKDGFYTHEGKEYRLSTHGFARDNNFSVVSRTKSSVCFKLQHSEETLKVFPFEFNFFVSYRLYKSALVTTYAVENTGAKSMYFALGGHPGLICPSAETEEYTDLSGNILIFEREENPVQVTVDPQTFLTAEEKPFGKFKEMPLSKEIFSPDAIILRGLKSRHITLRRKDGLDVRFGFDKCYTAVIWSKAKVGAFVCLEPWCGIPDNINPVRELKEKPGINSLPSGGRFEFGYRITVL